MATDSCSYRHDRVEFNSPRCPVCVMRTEMKEEMSDLRDKVTRAEEVVEDTTDTLKETQRQLTEAQNELSRLYSGKLDGER